MIQLLKSVRFLFLGKESLIMKRKDSRKSIWALIVLVIIIIFGFLYFIMFLCIGCYTPLGPSEQECRARFIVWCNQCLTSNWPDDFVIPSEILCMQHYNPLNMPLSKDSSCNYVKPLCDYYGIRNECEIHGGKCYGFGDLIAESCEDHEMVTLQYNCPQITLNTQCCSSATVPNKTCVDSDGGINYYVKGFANPCPCTKEPCPSCGVWADNCLNETTLLEYSCENLNGEEYFCPYGCQDGACLSQ
jgi:hypothetical protein